MVTVVTTNSDSTVVHWAIRPIEPPGIDVGVAVPTMAGNVVDGLMTTLLLDEGVPPTEVRDVGGEFGVPIVKMTLIVHIS